MSTIVTLNLAARLVRDTVVKEVLWPVRVSWSDWTILRVLHGGKARLVWVAAELGMPVSTGRPYAYALDVRGLVARTIEPGRVPMLELTAKGRALVEDLLPKVQAEEMRLLDGLTAVQIADLNDALGVLIEHLGRSEGDEHRTTPPSEPRRQVPEGLDPDTAHMADLYVNHGMGLKGVVAAMADDKGRGPAYSTVRARLIKAGVTLRPRGGHGHR